MNLRNDKELTIILATENINYRNNLASALRVQGYVVEFANGGFHLLHLLEYPSQTNLVIINEDMQDMPAHEIISLVRTNKDKNELPILFVAKEHTEEEIREIISVGANEYLQQTPSFQPILEKAKKYCSK